jgi:CheY-like chemotaxis protein/DNA-binding transcriptional regulator YiaG
VEIRIRMILATIVHCHSSSVVYGDKMSQIMATIDLKNLLGMAIKTQRTSLSISQEELAHRADLHRTYVSDLERGVRNPSMDSVEKLAHALELSVSDLFAKASGGNGSQQTVEILFVGNNPDDVELAKRAFAKANVTNPFHVVRDGAEALDFLLAKGPYTHRRDGRSPQLILLDLDLPRKSGLEVLREIKTDERTQKIPVIVLTGSNRDRDITECRRLGVVSHILKPVGFQNFSEVTARLSLGWMLIKPNADLPQ